MSSFLNRATFLKLFASSAQGPYIMPAVEQAFEALGWQTKQIFTRDDAQRLTVKLGELGEALLATSTNPAERALGEKVGPVLDEMRKLDA